MFPQHGPGRKHNRKIALEDWQQKIVDRHSGMFLRGLFHSDGSRFVNWVHAVTRAGRQEYEYIRYYFGNKSRDILEICGAALDSLGIPWRYTRPDNLAVSRKDAVAALDRIVGPKY